MVGIVFVIVSGKEEDRIKRSVIYLFLWILILEEFWISRLLSVLIVFFVIYRRSDFRIF